MRDTRSYSSRPGETQAFLGCFMYGHASNICWVGHLPVPLMFQRCVHAQAPKNGKILGVTTHSPKYLRGNHSLLQKCAYYSRGTFPASRWCEVLHVLHNSQMLFPCRCNDIIFCLTCYQFDVWPAYLSYPYYVSPEVKYKPVHRKLHQVFKELDRLKLRTLG